MRKLHISISIPLQLVLWDISILVQVTSNGSSMLLAHFTKHSRHNNVLTTAYSIVPPAERMTINTCSVGQFPSIVGDSTICHLQSVAGYFYVFYALFIGTNVEHKERT